MGQNSQIVERQQVQIIACRLYADPAPFIEPIEPISATYSILSDTVAGISRYTPFLSIPFRENRNQWRDYAVTVVRTLIYCEQRHIAMYSGDRVYVLDPSLGEPREVDKFQEDVLARAAEYPPAVIEGVSPELSWLPESEEVKG